MQTQPSPILHPNIEGHVEVFWERKGALLRTYGVPGKKWSTQQVKPAIAVESPRALINKTGERIDIFYRSAGKLIDLHQVHGGSWSAYEVAAGPILGEPVPILESSGMDVFWRDQTKAIYRRSYEGGTWNTSQLVSSGPADSELASAPAASLIAWRNAQKLWGNDLSGNNDFTISANGSLKGDPTAGFGIDPDRKDVFWVRQSDGALMTSWKTNGSWSDTVLDAQADVDGRPAPLQGPQGIEADVYWCHRVTRKLMRTRRKVSVWSTEEIPGQKLDSVPAALRDKSGTLVVFWRNAAGLLAVTWSRDGKKWHSRELPLPL